MNIFRSRTFEYRATTASPAAVDLESAAVGVSDTCPDCLSLMVGMECGDSTSSTAAAKIGWRIAAETDASYIVINGCSHLANPGERSDIPTALHVPTNLGESAQDRGARVHLVPFGWKKLWQADALDGEREQRVVHLPS